MSFKSWLVICFKNKIQRLCRGCSRWNEETSVGDDVFQVNELVEPYRVASSIDLEKNSNFHIFDNSLVNLDAKELVVVLISSGQAQIDEDDDNNVIKVEDCDGATDDSIEE